MLTPVLLILKRKAALTACAAGWKPVIPPWMARFGGWPAVAHQLLPYPPKYYVISGTTEDNTGAALGGCVVTWYRTADDTVIDRVTSDANGLFEFRTAGQPPTAYYLRMTKAGSPEVTGTTVSTLTAV